MNEPILIKKNTSLTIPVWIENNMSPLADAVSSIDNQKIIVLWNDASISKLLKDEIKTMFPTAEYVSYESCNIPFLGKKINEADVLYQTLVRGKNNQNLILWFVQDEYESLIAANISELKNLSYLLIPVTPVAQITCEYIRTYGDIDAAEVFPKGIYLNSSVWEKAEVQDFLSGIACAMRKGIQESSSLYEWMISNLYEILDKEAGIYDELMKKSSVLAKNRIEKKTTAERCNPLFGTICENVFFENCKELSFAEIISLSCIAHAHISWKKDILSMEEFYEIRDMFVAFGLGISQTELTANDFSLKVMEENKGLWPGIKHNTENVNENFVYLRKLGSVTFAEAPVDTLLKEAGEDLYFDPTSME